MPTIRRAVPADAGEVLTLQRAAWVPEAQLHDTPFIPPLEQTLDELRADIENLTVLVAVAGHRIVGTVRAYLTASTDGSAWFVAKLGVAPDQQGLGIGSQLLTAIEAQAPVGATRFALTTGPKSIGNIAFYERRGYVQVPTDHFLVHLTKDRPALETR